MASSCKHRHPLFRLTHLLMICFDKGFSYLPDLCQSLHILPWDLLVTSSWLPDDNRLLTWLHFMISSFLSPHSFIPRNFQYLVPCLYTTTSYSIWGHIMLISSVNDNLCIGRDTSKVHHLQPYDTSLQHPVLAYKYMYLIFSLFDSSCRNLFRMNNFIPLTCIINMSSYPNPKIM